MSRARAAVTGVWPGAGDALLTGASPRYQLYRTRDGRWIAAAPLEDRFWEAFCEVIELPASALTRQDGEPAVWVVDPESSTVALRFIDVVRFEPASVVVADGVEPGDVVVTAGVQALHPGQKVRLLGARS